MAFLADIISKDIESSEDLIGSELRKRLSQVTLDNFQSLNPVTKVVRENSSSSSSEKTEDKKEPSSLLDNVNTEVKINRNLTLSNGNLLNQNSELNVSISNNLTIFNNTLLNQNSELNVSISNNLTISNNTLLNQNSELFGNNNHNSVSNLNYRCCCPNCSRPLTTDEAPQNLVTTTSTTSTTTNSTASTSLIDALLVGSKWTVNSTNPVITYSFYENDIFKGSYYGSETGVKEVSEGIKTNVRSIFNWIKTIINVDFQEVTETNQTTFGQIRFLESNGPSYAYAYYPSTYYSIGGDVHLNPNYDYKGDTNGFQNSAGLHGYLTLIHEIGHALGLKHSFEGSNSLSPELDNSNNTIMGYNFLNGDVSTASTFMPLDIAALQSLYGANTAYNTENTNYVFTSGLDKFTVNGQSLINTTNNIKETLWDGGGNDTIDLSQLVANSAGYRIDLNPGGFLTANNIFDNTNYTVNGVTYKSTGYGTSIAYDANIENVINSKSNDTIYLNNLSNFISGYSANRVTGNDVIFNGTNQDTLRVEYDANAVIRSQNGNDLLLGLGTNGSIRVKDYYLDTSNQINIVYNATAPIINPLTNLNSNNLGFKVNGLLQSAAIESYAGTAQDVKSTVTVKNNEFQLVGNGWKKIGLDYNITKNTVLKFDFRSTSQGEIQGIGFDTDNTPEPNRHFTLYGTQNWGGDIKAFDNYKSTDGWKTYTINVGAYFTGQFNFLTFVNDHDVNNPTASSQYSNIEIYENTPQTTSSVITTQAASTPSLSLTSQNIIAQIISNTGIDVTGVTKNQSLVGHSLQPDILSGSKAVNTFVLGNKNTAYYANSQFQDFALIEGFNAEKGDIIQLHGQGSSYDFVSLTEDKYQGIAIIDKSQNTPDLIAVVQDVASLNVDSKSISFV